ncbi:B12-binding domain-containing radical SAM protein [Sulfurimonas sp. HSL-3221]|uniref:B12-binding domain-containing radical SAM protein n=1 Tax=Sulfurimonadaceae TaxID=2771471 RepID=UPI001E3E87CC|nr:B12-binding domain-containing radical SAM protein [Sulfurimonas sp. HSL-3221]UFS63072.1 B12-binding domain-containing radical SAM protein [Sulfurimonas sp. HSL-3221]
MHTIVLATFNARYSHASLALRYLYANLRELRPQSVIREFVINENIQQLAERILAEAPKIVGISTYIWNAGDVAELIGILKKVSPETVVVLGGPEASHLPHRVDFSHADYIISGEGEIAFYELCRDLLAGTERNERMIKAPMVDLTAIALPYDDYDSNDIQNRYVYLETSRGCPYLCEFCLSAIDDKMRYFDIDVMTAEFEKLWQRGVRSYKFIDRTFNLKLAYANRILDFFLAKDEPYFLHFEVIPDHFPEALRGRIARFAPAALQLEVGIQTLNPAIAENIHRPLRLAKIEENLRFLEEHTRAHLHLDLIVGLPGETLESFAKGLDTLVSWSSGEIQIGILKKLSGTTMARHDDPFGMVYSDAPPYDVLKTTHVSFEEIQRMKRFARYWDILYNSGNFARSVALLWPEGKVFDGFRDFSAWVYGETAATWKIAQERMARLLFDYLVDVRHCDKERVGRAMAADFAKSHGKRLPPFLRTYAPEESSGGEAAQGSASTKRQSMRA